MAFHTNGTKMGPKNADPLRFSKARSRKRRPERPQEQNGTKALYRRKRLTATQINALPSAAAPYSVSDPEMSGLSLHVPAKLGNARP